MLITFENQDWRNAPAAGGTSPQVSALQRGNKGREKFKLSRKQEAPVKVSCLFCLAFISFKRVLKLPSCWSVKIVLSFNQVSTSSRLSAQQSVKIVSFNLVLWLSASYIKCWDCRLQVLRLSASSFRLQYCPLLFVLRLPAASSVETGVPIWIVNVWTMTHVEVWYMTWI